MSTYFNTTGLKTADGNDAEATDINNLVDEIDGALDQVEQDINSVSGVAEEWATNPQGTPIEPGKYSALAYAEEAMAWAQGLEGIDTQADGSTVIPYSAKVRAQAANSSALAASTSESNALIYKNDAYTYRVLSEDWASEAVGTLVDATDYSSKAYATESKNYATTAEDVVVTGADGASTGLYSAKHYSLKAEAWYDATVLAASGALSDIATDLAAAIASIQSEGNYQVSRVIAQGVTEQGNVSAQGAISVAEVAAQGSIQVGLATDQADAAAASAVAAAASAAAASVSAASVDLAAISETLLSSTNIVDVFIYDTANDSDGGEWRKRCTNKSWYLETLNTATRGETREFPKLALIVAETDKVTILDGTQSDTPMWMVFEGISNGTKALIISSDGDVTSVSAKNGVVAVGCDGTGWLNLIDFLKDITHSFYTGGKRTYYDGLADRNSRDSSNFTNDTTQPIVNRACNAVDMTVLDDAPYDVVTGLPVPTIAVATDGGTSIIDGPSGVDTVVDSTNTVAVTSLNFGQDNCLNVNQANGNLFVYFTSDMESDPMTYTQVYNRTTAPSILNGSSPFPCSEGSHIGNSLGLTLMKHDHSNRADGMSAYITNTYNTGWMAGAIKGAFLSDSVEETIGDDITTELVTNGDFDDEEGWTLASTTIGSGVNTWGGSAGMSAYQNILTPGNSYRMRFEVKTATAGTLTFDAGATQGYAHTTVGFKEEVLECTSNGFAFFSSSDFQGTIDNVSVQEVTEMCPQGTFDDEEDWIFTEPSGSTAGVVSGEVELVNTSATPIASQLITTVANSLYRVRIENTGATNATVGIGNSPGTYYEIHTQSLPAGEVSEFVFTATGTSTYLNIWKGVAGTATLDNVSVQELDEGELISNGTFDDDEGWSLGTNWAIGSGVASVAIAPGADSSIYQNFTGLTSGGLYRFRYNLVSRSAGNFRFNVDGTGENEDVVRTTVGTHEGTFTAPGTTMTAGGLASSLFVGSIDNFSIQPVTSLVPSGGWGVYNFEFYNTASADGGSLTNVTKVSATGNGSVYKTLDTLTVGEVYTADIFLTDRAASPPIVSVGYNTSPTAEVAAVNLVAGWNRISWKCTNASYNAIHIRNIGTIADFDLTLEVTKANNLIEDSNFSIASPSWLTASGAWIASGKGNFPAANSYIYQGGITDSSDTSKYYRATVTIDSITGGGNIAIKYYNGSSSWVNVGSRSSAGILTAIFSPDTVSANEYVTVHYDGGGSGAVIDNFIVEEVTLVDGNWVTADEEVSNGGFEGLTTGWLNGGGDSLVQASQGRIYIDRNDEVDPDTVCYQDISTPDTNVIYEMTFNLIDKGAINNFRVKVDSQEIDFGLTVPTGVKTFTFKPTSTTTRIHLIPIGTTTNTATLDDITITEKKSLAVNGEFSRDAVWDTSDPDVSISGGALVFTDAANVSQTLVHSAGYYRVSFDLTRIGGNFYAGLGSWSSGAIASSGHKTYVGYSNGGSSTLAMATAAGASGSIENVIVEEVTMVDGQWVTADELVSNGGFEGLIPNWIDASDTGAVKGMFAEAGTLALEEDASASAAARAWTQVLSLDDGEMYEVSIDLDTVTNYAAGDVRLRVGTTANGTDIVDAILGNNPSTGTYTYIFEAPAGGVVYVSAYTYNHKLNIGNVTLTKKHSLIENGNFSWDDSGAIWSLGTNWSITGGQLVSLGTLSTGASQSNVVTLGQYYRVRMDIVSCSGDPTFVAQLWGRWFGTSDIGHFDEVIQANSNNFAIVHSTSGPRPITLDNIVVEHVTQDAEGNWVPANELVENPDFEGTTEGWTNYPVTDNYVVPDQGRMKMVTDSGYIAGYYSFPVTPGKTYQFDFTTVDGDTAARIYIGTAGVTGKYANQIVATGSWTYTVIPEAGDTTLYVYMGTQAASGYAYLSSMSIKQIQNRVANGNFSLTGTNQVWTDQTGGTWIIASGIAAHGATGTYDNLYQSLTGATLGKKYLVTFTCTVVAGQVRVALGTTAGTFRTSSGTYSEVIELTGLEVLYIGADVGFNGSVSDITIVELDEEDRSYNDNPIQVVGELTKAEVASGADLAGYSGFTGANYLLQPYNSDYNFGTGDFSVVLWMKDAGSAGAQKVLLARRAAGNTGAGFQIDLDTSGYPRLYTFSAAANSHVDGTTSLIDGNWHQVVVTVGSTATDLNLYIDGRPHANATVTGRDVDSTDALLFLGVRADTFSPCTGMSIAEVRISGTELSADQIKFIYEQERKMFEENADSLLPSSDAIDALAYDESTGELDVIQGMYKSTFVGLDRTVLQSSPVNFFEKIYKQGGMDIYSTVATAYFSAPALSLREELTAKDIELAKAQSPNIEYAPGVSAQVHDIPKGFMVVDVYNYSSGVRANRSGWTQEWNGFHYVLDLGATYTPSIVLRRI